VRRVIGWSRDSVASHDKFKKKYEFSLRPGFRRDGEGPELYGVWIDKIGVAAVGLFRSDLHALLAA